MTPDEKREYNRLYQREWCRRNPERSREIARESYARHRDKRVARARERRAARRQMIDDAKRTGCERCGFDDLRALVLHHRDPATKEFTISIEGVTVGEARFLAELAKCEVLCANCHMIHHADERADVALQA